MKLTKNTLGLLVITLLAIPMGTMLAFRPSPQDRLVHERLEKAQDQVQSMVIEAKTTGKSSALAELNALKEDVKKMPTGHPEMGLAELKANVMEKIAEAEKTISAQ